jgi:hypothetical protein
MVLEGTMAELLVRIDPQLYGKHLLTKKGKPIMYVQLKKVLASILEGPNEEPEGMGLQN